MLPDGTGCAASRAARSGCLQRANPSDIRCDVSRTLDDLLG